MKKIFCLFLSLILLISATASIAFPFIGQADGLVEYASTEGISIAPTGGTQKLIVNEKIEYSYKVVEEYVNPYKLPGYMSSYTCGITAGGVSIGYYDRIYEELIPNHTGIIFMGKFVYGSAGAEVMAMHDQLYTRMNATPQGVTMQGYINGMKSYVSSKGRTATLTSTMSGNMPNENSYKSALESGKLLSIFLRDFSIIDFSNFLLMPNYDDITAYVSEGAHIMAAYGYYIVSYYNAQGQCFRKDSYLYVNSGFTTPTFCLVKLNQYCIIDDCFILDIF